MLGEEKAHKKSKPEEKDGVLILETYTQYSSQHEPELIVFILEDEDQNKSGQRPEKMVKGIHG
jgi:hypothetical protein